MKIFHLAQWLEFCFFVGMPKLLKTIKLTKKLKDARVCFESIKGDRELDYRLLDKLN